VASPEAGPELGHDRPRHLLVAGLFLLIALVQTWPLVIELPRVMPNDLGDPLLNTWILWWNAHAVPLTTQWWNAPIFYPAPGAMAFSEVLLGQSLIASPVQWLGGGPVLAYNLVFLLSLLLFISIETSGADARLAVLVTDRPLLGAALGRFTTGVRRYLVVTTIFGLLFGLIDTIALWLMGIPLAVTWGLLAFITNYIPYVGFWLAGAADPPGQGGTRGQRPTGGLGGGLVGLTAARARPVVTGSRT